MNATTRTSDTAGTAFHGIDRLLYGMILGVVTFWLFAQTTLDTAPRVKDELAMREAALVALGFNRLMVVGAIASILLTILPGKRTR